MKNALNLLLFLALVGLASPLAAYADCTEDLLFFNGFDGGTQEAAKFCHRYTPAQIGCGKTLSQADEFNSTTNVAIADCAKYTPAQIQCAEKHSSAGRSVEDNLPMCTHSAAQIQCANDLYALDRFGGTMDEAVSKCVKTPIKRMDCAIGLLKNDLFAGDIDSAAQFCGAYTGDQIDCAIKQAKKSYDFLQVTVLICTGALAPDPVASSDSARCGDSI
jgi:hypothetical protein